MKADIYVRRFQNTMNNSDQKEATIWLVEDMVESIIRLVSSRERKDQGKFLDHMIEQYDATWRAVGRRLNLPGFPVDGFYSLAMQFLTTNSLEAQNE